METIAAPSDLETASFSTSTDPSLLSTRSSTNRCTKYRIVQITIDALCVLLMVAGVVFTLIESAKPDTANVFSDSDQVALLCESGVDYFGCSATNTWTICKNGTLMEEVCLAQESSACDCPTDDLFVLDFDSQPCTGGYNRTECVPLNVNLIVSNTWVSP